MRVEELQQQWKALETMGQLSHQLILELLHQLTDILSLKRPIGDVAGMVFAVAEDPRFPYRAAR